MKNDKSSTGTETAANHDAGRLCLCEYDNSTKLIIMGAICDVADEVYPARVIKAAEEIMAIMSRRKKPNKLWGVTATIAANSEVSNPARKTEN